MSTRSKENAFPGSPLPSGLYALCDDTVAPERSLWEKAQGCLQGGARTLQLRLKRTSGREAVEVARAIAGACRAQGACLILNDRVDWALLVQAQGVHLGDEDLPPAEARQLLGPGAIIGVTVRNLEGARRAHEAGATYVGLGPVFPTSTKQVPAPVLGVDKLRAFCRETPLPVVAIGGIGLSTIAEVAQAGAHAAAVASDLLCAPDVAERARKLCAEFERGTLGRTLEGQGAPS